MILRTGIGDKIESELNRAFIFFPFFLGIFWRSGFGLGKSLNGNGGGKYQADV